MTTFQYVARQGQESALFAEISNAHIAANAHCLAPSSGPQTSHLFPSPTKELSFPIIPLSSTNTKDRSTQFSFYRSLREKLALITTCLSHVRDKELDRTGKLQNLALAVQLGKHMLRLIGLSPDAFPEIFQFSYYASQGLQPLQQPGNSLVNGLEIISPPNMPMVRPGKDWLLANFKEMGIQRSTVLFNIPVEPMQPVIVGWQKEIEALSQQLHKKEEEKFETLLAEANLGILKHTIEAFFVLPEAQMILESDEGTSEFSLLYKRSNFSAVLDLDLSKFGPDLHDPHNTKIKLELEKEKDYLQSYIKNRVYHFAYCYLKEHGITRIEHERAKTIYGLLEILMKKTYQLSEQAFLWMVLYALEASASTSTEQFTWVLSVGGDQEPPSLIEGYLLDPLHKLQSLSKQRVSVLPRLFIIGTFPSQIAENSSDKLGRPIRPELHIHNSRITLERCTDFIERYYPAIANQCAFLEFPAYERTGSARILFAALWTLLEAGEQEKMAKMFSLIRGEVTNTEEDEIQILFGQDSMSYAGRHLISNGHMISGQHILRFGAKNTEPQFWFAGCKLRDLLFGEAASDQSPAQSLLNNIEKTLMRSSLPPQQQTAILAEITDQLAQWNKQPQKGYLQGQVGMCVPALYYRRPDEPSLQDMTYAAKAAIIDHMQHSSKEGTRRLEKMQIAYTRLINYIHSEEELAAFLTKWAERYLPYEVDSEKLSLSNKTLYRNRLQHPSNHEAYARTMLNFVLY